MHVSPVPARRDIDCESTSAAINGRPVAGDGQMMADGYVPENGDHFEALTEVIDGRRRGGRDPMALDTAILTAAGHGPHRSRAIITAMGDMALAEGVRGYTSLRRQCLVCAENAAEVRRCVIIDCPIWPYRMGRNPHNPRRGTNPFLSAVAPQ